MVCVSRSLIKKISKHWISEINLFTMLGEFRRLPRNWNRFASSQTRRKVLRRYSAVNNNCDASNTRFMKMYCCKKWYHVGGDIIIRK